MYVYIYVHVSCYDYDLKAFRQRCLDLNKTYLSELSKRKLFVVIS